MYLNCGTRVNVFCVLNEPKKGTPHALPSALCLPRQCPRATQPGAYFCFTAMAEISTRALFTRAAA
jgi:hypothetical protein